MNQSGVCRRMVTHLLRGLITILISSLVAGYARAEPAIRPADRIAIIGNTFADQLRVHGYLETLLLQRSGERPVSLRHLGWAGDMLLARDRPTNFPSETSELIEHQTDVILACFGMGESFAGPEGLADFRTALEAFAASHRGQSYNGTSAVRLIFVSPIAYEDLGKLTPDWERRNRDLAAYTAVMGQVAARQEMAFVDLHHPTRQLMADAAGAKLTLNGIHLNAYGYWLVSRLLADTLAPGDHGWSLQIDARSEQAAGRGVAISDVDWGGDGVRFRVREESWPTLAPPISGKRHPSAEKRRDSLVVLNLAPGEYLLTIEGEPVVAANHERWAHGMPIDASPMHRAAEAFRQAVNDKNQQFNYSWKALNQVHIVGERKTSPSGQALPAELMQFKALAERKEQALRAGFSPQSREWRLTRNTRPGSRP